MRYTSNNYPDNPEIRRKSQKCFVDRSTNDVILRLHETDIVRVRPNGDIILSTGGWATHKTLRSMNDALELFDMWVESTDGNVPRGNWVVYDTDGMEFPYTNTKQDFNTTIPARGDDAHNRCKWLAEAYNVPYTPRPPPQASRVVSAPPMPAAAIAAPVFRPAAAPAGPPTAAMSVPAASGRQPGGGSWANIARSGVSPPAATVARPSAAAHAPPARMTGPGAAAAAHPSSIPAPTSPGSSLRALDVARSKLNAAAAAAGSTAAAAAVPSVPVRPVAEQLEEHMKQLGIHEDELEDDMHLCVVCMEHPRSIVLVPCGHMALCRMCCKTIVEEQKKECPMCCQPVEYHVEVNE